MRFVANFFNGTIAVARWIPLIIGLPLIGISTYIQGSWTDRWTQGTDKELVRLAERYQSIPTAIGTEWVGQDIPFSKQELAEAGAHAHISRAYRNSKTGDQITIYMICGYARDVAVHTPEYCYVGSGYEVESRPDHFAFATAGGDADDTNAEFWTSTFLKERGDGAIHQRILWAWDNGENWQAPHNPRLQFPGNSVLNKVYLITNIKGGTDELSEKHPAVQFGKLFLPLVRETLYPPAPADSTP